MSDIDFLTTIVSQLTDNVDDVCVNRITDERGVLLTLQVNPLDMGRIIGKGGETASALRTVMRAYGMKHNAHYSLKIEDGGRRS